MLSAREALHGLWPQLLFGVAAVTILALTVPGVILWAGLTLLPCLLAVPFTCITSARGFGRVLTRARLCAIPDELAPSWELIGGERAQADAPQAAAP